MFDPNFLLSERDLMPLYEYQCKDCEIIHEVQHRMSENGPTDCPGCGQSALKRIISKTAFTLKGGGWYTDGYTSATSNPPKKEPAKTEKPAAPATKPTPKSSSSPSQSGV
jgi:putative FmdB family regulatory protein